MMLCVGNDQIRVVVRNADSQRIADEADRRDQASQPAELRQVRARSSFRSGGHIRSDWADSSEVGCSFGTGVSDHDTGRLPNHRASR